MSAITYEQIALAWQPDRKQESGFRILFFSIVAAFLLLGIVLYSIPLPEKERMTQIDVPDRVARFITEKPKPPPRVVAEPKPPAPLRPEPRFERQRQEERKPLTQLEQEARKKAESSGLLALTQSLSDLVNTANVSAMLADNVSRTSDSQSAARVDTNILATAPTHQSGGVSSERHDGSVGRSTLDGEQKHAAQQLLATHGSIGSTDAASAANSNRRSGSNLRSESDVAFVMDQHKSALHSIYRRARRANPGLQGKIVLEITILPSGQVSDVRVKSSELNDKTLESSLIARIRQFDFGQSSAEPLTVVVPVEFLPS